MDDKAKEKELLDKLADKDKKFKLKEKAFTKINDDLKKFQVENQELKEKVKNLENEVLVVIK